MTAITGRGHMSALRVALVLAAAVAVAVAANLILLGVAGGSEPVGTLSPRAGILATTPTPTAPVQSVPMATARHGGDTHTLPGDHARGEGDD